MKNVYSDPGSYVHLQNVAFANNEQYNTNNCRGAHIFLKEYCAQRNINLQTIDFWDSKKANKDDIYVSFDHKFFLRKIYWKLRNKNYPIVNPKKFQKSILFQIEPPVVMPEIRYLIRGIIKTYSKVFFTWKVDDKRANYMYIPQAHAGIFSEYWKNEKRGFVTLINSNRKSFSRYKELLTERIRAILAFGKTNDIDLYGFDWDKPPLFPYWFHKNKVQKTYRGSIKNKYQVLSRYTFAFAFENCELPGYITDKIFDCFFVGTIPIYLGAPDIAEYIPRNCFIDMRNFKSYEELRMFLKSLPESEIKTYKENGLRFLESERYKFFTKEHFAKIFVEACESNS